MKRIIDKASVLIEALPYIKSFRGKKMVIKCGGSVMNQETGLRDLLQDIVFMHCIGIQTVLVHGGGPAISKAMQEQGIVAKFINGLRVTDRQTMDIVEKVLIQQINQQITNILNEMGAKAMGVHSRAFPIIHARKHFPLVDGQPCDIGYVGEVIHVNAGLLHEWLHEGKIPVIPPIGIDEEGQVYNINGDVAAGFIASSIGAWKLVYLTDTPGILRHPDDESSAISSITQAEIEQLIEEKIITDGMLPKITACIKALKYGVKKAHIIDGRVHHSLLLEVFTKEGIGTEIIRNGS